MNILALIMRELVALFVDDEFLALGVLAVIGLAAFCGAVLSAPPFVVGGVLIIGSVGILVLSALKTIRRS